jgi:hypothetical protein
MPLGWGRVHSSSFSGLLSSRTPGLLAVMGDFGQFFIVDHVGVSLTGVSVGTGTLD